MAGRKSTSQKLKAKPISRCRPAVSQPVPLVAGIWGVRCLPGPAWENAPRGATWGTVLNPSTVVHD
eukprot:5008556-Heterocapsa_arctica.AAC.1